MSIFDNWEQLSKINLFQDKDLLIHKCEYKSRYTG